MRLYFPITIVVFTIAVWVLLSQEAFSVNYTPKMTKLVFQNSQFSAVRAIKNETDPSINDGEKAVMWSFFMCPKKTGNFEYDFNLKGTPRVYFVISNVDLTDEIELTSENNVSTLKSIKFSDNDRTKRARIVLDNTDNDSREVKLSLTCNLTGDSNYYTLFEFPVPIDDQLGPNASYLPLLPFNIYPNLHA